MNKYKFFGVVSLTKTSEDIYHAIDEYLTEEESNISFFRPAFRKINGVTVARIDSIADIGTEEEPISYERHPIYICLESDYEKVKHLDD